MKVMVFGATGMVGQGVLRECLIDPGVTHVLSIGRRLVGQQDSKLHEIVHADLLNLSSIEAALAGYDACFFCIGLVPGKFSEAQYRHVTYDITMAIANTLVRLNPAMTFIYVTGVGTDSSEQSKTMWARVKGASENALFELPFKAVHVFRPAAIQPLHGVRSNTGWDFLYAIKPLWTLWRWIAPQYCTSTEEIGRAMLAVARKGHARRILYSNDFRAVALEGGR
eukprot:TRINITY_DN12871_c0_g1_i12.p1 TRINITY_DN12871_c0_g1~~TRINITY_DN12871_c0_g1_i12.p1  ORF type:complete len:224 (-),score=38.23 TRINITY_DN12871_c0_g1_i12:536-1207(-)